ncbi:hypothetical protein [Streptomyces sp. NPDC055056]
MLAERVRQRRLTGGGPRVVQADHAGEELAVGVDQGDESHRDAEQFTDQPGEAVHPRIRGGRQSGVTHGVHAQRIRDGRCSGLRRLTAVRYRHGLSPTHIA